MQNNIADIEVRSVPDGPLKVRVIYGEAACVAEIRERMRQRMIAMGIFV